jgi:hypothetical protein
MRMTFRDLAIELSDDDPRTLQVLALLFGPVAGNPPAAVEPAPPPPAAPPEPPAKPPEVVAPPPPPPRVVVPPNVKKLWGELDTIARRNLELLATAVRSPIELETALGIDHRGLMGRHSYIGRFASRFGLGKIILTRGRWRENRRMWLRADLVPYVVALAEGRAE